MLEKKIEFDVPIKVRMETTKKEKQHFATN